MTTPHTANYDEVICPNCVTQFRAIPVNVQDILVAQAAEIERLKEDRAMGDSMYNLAHAEMGELRAEQAKAAVRDEQTSKRVPLTDVQVVEGYCNCKSVHQFVQAFEHGTRFAEKHHGITKD